MTTARQDREFVEAMIDSSLLENALAWIAVNMSPEDVFDETDLKDWAIENGFVPEKDKGDD